MKLIVGLFISICAFFVGCHFKHNYAPENIIKDEYVEDASLLPCPLCKNQPFVRKRFIDQAIHTGLIPPSNVENPHWLYGVRCLTEGCLVSDVRVLYWRTTDAVEVWNKRVQLWLK